VLHYDSSYQDGQGSFASVSVDDQEVLEGSQLASQTSRPAQDEEVLNSADMFGEFDATSGSESEFAAQGRIGRKEAAKLFQSSATDLLIQSDSVPFGLPTQGDNASSLGSGRDSMRAEESGNQSSLQSMASADMPAMPNGSTSAAESLVPSPAGQPPASTSGASSAGQWYQEPSYGRWYWISPEGHWWDRQAQAWLDSQGNLWAADGTFMGASAEVYSRTSNAPTATHHSMGPGSINPFQRQPAPVQQ